MTQPSRLALQPQREQDTLQPPPRCRLPEKRGEAPAGAIVEGRFVLGARPQPGATAGHLSGAQQEGPSGLASITAEVPASPAQVEAETTTSQPNEVHPRRLDPSEDSEAHRPAEEGEAQGPAVATGTAEDLAPCSSAEAEVVTGQGLETALSPSGDAVSGEGSCAPDASEGAASPRPSPAEERAAVEGAGLDRVETVSPPAAEAGVSGEVESAPADPAAFSPSQTAPLAPEVESVRWESPPGVPEEPSSRLSPSAEPSSGGGADGSRAAVSAGVVGQPAGASAGVGALVGAGPSRPGPSGDRQPEHGADPAPPASPSCPPSPVPVSVVDERAPAPVPGVGMRPEGDGFGTELRTARQVFLLALDREEERMHELQLRVVELEQRLAQVESLEQRAAELEAENARLRGKVEHVLGFLGAP